MKKKIIAVALASALCLSGASLVACGGSSSNTSSTSSNTAATATNNESSSSSASSNSSSSSSSASDSDSKASGISESEAKDIADDFLKSIISKKAHGADASKSTYKITATKGSSSEGYVFIGNGTLRRSNGNPLPHASSFSFKVKVTPNGHAGLRGFSRR